MFIFKHNFLYFNLIFILSAIVLIIFFIKFINNEFNLFLLSYGVATFLIALSILNNSKNRN